MVYAISNFYAWISLLSMHGKPVNALKPIALSFICRVIGKGDVA